MDNCGGEREMNIWILYKKSYISNLAGERAKYFLRLIKGETIVSRVKYMYWGEEMGKVISGSQDWVTQAFDSAHTQVSAGICSSRADSFCTKPEIIYC
jgi:hypothetical protein